MADRATVSTPASRVSGIDPFAQALRVLHVAQPATGGVARMVELSAEYQARHGWDVHVAAAAQVPSATWHPWNAHRSPAKGVAAESRALEQILAEVDPQVVVLHSSKAGLVGRLVLRGRRPTVFLPHAWSFLALPPVPARAALEWERLAARWTNAVVAVGEGEAELTVRRRIRAPLFVVPNAVPPGWPLAAPGERAAARARLGLADGPLVVSVGRVSHQKGHDVLVEAWPSVTARVPGARAVVVGGGELLAGLSAAAPAGLAFVGERTDARDFVAAADVVALPSRWEGLSLAMLEALATGRAVVSADVAGSEVVSRSGGGAVVPVEDPAALGRALVDRLSGDVDADEEGRAGAAYVQEHHGLEVCQQQAAAVILRAHAFGTSRPG